MTACCEGAATCLGCGRSWCREERPSPGEASGICVDCYEQEDVA